MTSNFIIIFDFIAIVGDFNFFKNVFTFFFLQITIIHFFSIEILHCLLINYYLAIMIFLIIRISKYSEYFKN